MQSNGLCLSSVTPTLRYQDPPAFNDASLKVTAWLEEVGLAICNSTFSSPRTWPKSISSGLPNTNTSVGTEKSSGWW